MSRCATSNIQRPQLDGSAAIFMSRRSRLSAFYRCQTIFVESMRTADEMDAKQVRFDDLAGNNAESATTDVRLDDIPSAC